MFGTQKIKSVEVYKHMKKHIQQAVKEIISQYDRIDPEYFNRKKERYKYCKDIVSVKDKNKKN